MIIKRSRRRANDRWAVGLVMAFGLVMVCCFAMASIYSSGINYSPTLPVGTNGLETKKNLIPLSATSQAKEKLPTPKAEKLMQIRINESKRVGPAIGDAVCICNGRLGGISKPLSLSSPYFRRNDVVLNPVNNTKGCCADLEPQQGTHVFFSEPFEQYGHLVLNGVAPLWDRLQRLKLINHTNLVIHLICSRVHAETQFVQDAMSLFGGDVVVHNASEFSSSKFFAFNTVLGLAGIELDHYNLKAPAVLWKDFRDFLKTKLLEDHGKKSIAALGPKKLRVSIVQRIQNQKKGNRVILDVDKIVEQTKLHLRSLHSQVEVDVVVFDGLTMHEQSRIMSRTDIFLGADGTGVVNGLFMPENSCIITILPYGVSELLPGKGENFKAIFDKLEVPYYTIDSLPVDGSTENYRKAELVEGLKRYGFLLNQNLNISQANLQEKLHKCVERIKLGWAKAGLIGN